MVLEEESKNAHNRYITISARDFQYPFKIDEEIIRDLHEIMTIILFKGLCIGTSSEGISSIEEEWKSG